MPAFDAWDVVKVPFPYTGRPVRQYRPALVVAAGEIQAAHGLLWVVMITSAENRGWSADVEVTDLDVAGLPAASVVRTAKIATIEAKEAQRLGTLTEGDRAAVRRNLATTLAFAAH
jgi:PemK-like protein.